MTTVRTGRPRDDTIDQRAREAARELLTEVGAEGTTMQAVADRAGIHTSAIYRRWSSPIELIEEAFFPGFEPPVVEPTGDLRADLRRFLRAYLRAFNSPAAKAAIPALLAHRHSSGDRSPEQLFRVSTRPQFFAIMQAAAPSDVDPRLDRNAAFDLVLGAVLARTLVPTVVGRGSLDTTLDLLLRMLAPTGDAAETSR